MVQNMMARPIVGGLRISGLFALAGIAGPVILVVCDCLAGLSTPNYSFIQDSISSLAWTRLGWVQTIGFLAIGLLIELFVAGLYLSIHGVRGFGFGIGLLVFFGFGLLLIGAFHTNLAGGPQSFEGAIHGFVARAIFWLFSASTLFMAPSIKKDENWRPLFLYTIVTSLFSLIFMLSGVWSSEDSGWFGLYERILVAVEIIWVEVMAIKLLHYALKTRLVY
jgi:hypothetical protein